MSDSLHAAPVPRLATTRLRHYWAIALILLFALPSMLIHLGTGDANDMMEMFNLVPVKEAYRDGHWLMPTLNGLPRLEKPPLPVWLPAGLATLVGNDSLWVVRLPSIAAALLACLATYAIGCVTLGRRSGLIAAIILASMTVFMRQSRIASYDIFATAFTTVGLLGLIQMTIATGRRWPWAILAGAALALANLSKGPIPPATVCLPFGVWIICYHRHSWKFWRNLLLAFIICIVVTAPWFIAIELQLPGAHKTWVSEFFQYSTATAPQFTASKWYYFQMIPWVMPWTALLVAGLVMPFIKDPHQSTATNADRRIHWLFWLIILLGALLLTIPSEKKPRYALQLLPAAALLCAAVWEQFINLRTTDKINAGARALLTAQNLILAGIGLTIFGGLAVTYWFPQITQHFNWLPDRAQVEINNLPHTLRPGFNFLGIAAWIVIGLVPLIMTIVMWRMHRQRRFKMAFLAFALGIWPALLGWNWVYRGVNDYHADPYRDPTLHMVQLAEGHPIYTFDIYRPWLHVLFYADAILPQKQIPEIVALAKQPAPIYLLIPASAPPNTNPSTESALATAALADIQHQTGRTPQPLYTFNDEHCDLTLYRLYPIH